MNDNELTTVVRQPFAAVHMSTPVDAVVRRGRVLRRRKRLPALIGATAVAAAAVAFATVPGAHPGAPRQRLAAWTVTREADGTLTIAIHELKDPAGLQARLRADGVPARVAFHQGNDVSPPLPAGCKAPRMSDEANARLQDKILPPPEALPQPRSGFGQISILRIKPSAIPPGIGLFLGVSASAQNAYIGVDLVVISPQCTG